VSPPPIVADPNDLLGTYSFLPWLRQGIANAITAPPVGLRASIRVDLKLVGAPIGPGAPHTAIPTTSPHTSTPTG